MTRLKFKEIEDDYEALIMADIFNDSIPFLETKEKLLKVDDAHQVAWWRNRDKKKVRAWLVRERNTSLIVGFLLLQQKDPFFCTPLFSILKKFQGKGYAREFITFYLREAWGPLAGEQLVGNERICQLNDKMGWIKMGTSKNYQEKEVDLLYHPGIIHQPDERQEEIYGEILDYHGIKAETHAPLSVNRTEHDSKSN